MIRRSVRAALELLKLKPSLVGCPTQEELQAILSRFGGLRIGRRGASPSLPHYLHRIAPAANRGLSGFVGPTRDRIRKQTPLGARNSMAVQIAFVCKEKQILTRPIAIIMFYIASETFFYGDSERHPLKQ